MRSSLTSPAFFLYTPQFPELQKSGLELKRAKATMPRLNMSDAGEQLSDIAYSGARKSCKE